MALDQREFKKDFQTPAETLEAGRHINYEACSHFFKRTWSPDWAADCNHIYIFGGKPIC